jgi:hypothetical protein
MTLIVTALAEDAIWQVSDRRLTKAGILYDDSAVKQILVRCFDGIFIMGHTGMALTRGDWGDRVDEWAVKTISALPLDTLNVAASLGTPSCRVDEPRHGRSSNSSKRSKDRLGDRRLRPPPGPFAARVTNYEDIDGNPLHDVADEFQVFTSLRNNKPMRRLDMIFVGTEAAIHGAVRTSIHKARSKLYRRRPKLILNGLVQIVRKAAADIRHGHFISKHCMGTFIEQSGQVCCFDCPASGSMVVSTPHQVSAGLSALGVTIESPSLNTIVVKGRFKFGSSSPE